MIITLNKNDYYIVFQLAYLDVNPCWFSVQWLDAILNCIRAIRILYYANELILCYANELLY